MNISDIISNLANAMPIPIFSFFASFVEEILGFVPSPVVLTLIGSISEEQQKGWLYLGAMVVLATIGKVIGFAIFYQVAKYFKKPLVENWSQKVGISKKEVEKLEKYFDKSYSDEITLIFLRAIPVIPAGPVSILAGFLSLNFSSFLWASFLGILIRNSFYAVIGYTGSNLLEKYSSQLSTMGTIGIVVLVIGVFAGGYWMAKKKLA